MNASEFTSGPLTIDEMMKIISLLENPPEASDVRKALRFYQVPEGLECKWGDSAEVMAELRRQSCPHDLSALMKLIEDERCKSLLVVGGGYGGALMKLASVMPKGSQIVAVEKPANGYLNPVASLKETCRQISRLGAKIELFLGDPKSAKVIDAVSNYGPYDFVFDPEGLYAEMGRIVSDGVSIVYRE